MYKKAAAALLIAAMAFTLFAGCKNKNGTDTSTSGSTEPSSTLITVYSAEQLGSAVTADTALFTVPLAKNTETDALALFGLQKDIVSDYVYYNSSEMTPEEVLAVRAVSSNFDGAIMQGFENRKAALQAGFQNIDTAQVVKIENALIYHNGDYYVFCVCLNPNGARAVLDSLFPASADATSAVSTEPSTEPTTETTTQPTTEPTAEPTTVPTTEPTTTAAPTTEPTTTAAPTTEPTTTAAPTKAQLSAGEIASSIASKSSLFKETMNPASTSMGLGYFRISDSMVADSAYYKGTSAVADELLVVKLAPGTSADTVMNCFRTRQASQVDDYSDYVPSEVPKIENAVMYSNGDYCVFCVSENAGAVRSLLNDMIG